MEPHLRRTEPNVVADLARLGRTSRRYQRRRSTARFFSRVTHLATPGGVALLTAAFLSKLLWPPLIYGLALLPVWLLVVAGYLLSRPGLWAVPPWQADALADLRSGSRGTFMALEEARGEEWSAALGRADVPLPVGFPWGQSLRWAGAAAVLVAVLLVPDLRPRRLRVAPAVTPLDRMEDLVATLREEELAEEHYLERVEQVLKEMRQETSRSLRAEDWQALDGFRADLKRQLLDSHRRLKEEQSRFAALRNAMNQAREPTADELRQMAEQLAQFAQALQMMDPAELAAMCKQMGLAQLSPEEIAELLRACESGRCQFSEADREALRALLLAAEGECEGKAGFCAGLLRGLGVCEGGLLPGRGGIDRGPGPAPLLGAGDTDPDFGEFESKTFGGNLGETQVPLGFSFAPPDEAGPAAGAEADGPGAAVQFGAGNERITWHSRLLPRHNDVMKSYFAEQVEEEAR